MATFSICPKCGRHVLKISWSGVRTFQECKQKYKQQSAGRRNKLQDVRVFFPGNVTDRTVRSWLKNDPLQHLGEMPDMVDSIIDQHLADEIEHGRVMRWKNRADRELVRQKCIQAVTDIEPALLKHVVPYEYVADYAFQAPIETTRPDGVRDTILLNGKMDIFVHHPKTDTWAVFDVKHTENESYWRKTIGQLGFYDLATELMEGKPASYTALLQPLCKRKVVPYMPTAESRVQLAQDILEMASSIWKNEMPPKTTTEGCNYCDVKHACSRFTAVTQDGKHRVSLQP